MIRWLALMSLALGGFGGRSIDPLVFEAPPLDVDAGDLTLRPVRVWTPRNRGGIIGKKRRARASGRHDWRRRAGCRS